MSTTNDNNNANSGDTFDNSQDFWWWTPDAYAAKLAITASIFVIFVAYFLGGYLHAQRRIKKGLPPLAYHRWLLSRSQRAQWDPHYQQQQFTVYPVHQDSYAMQGYTLPPPAYNPNAPIPPSYQPPNEGSKILPSQTVYHPPPGRPGSPSNAELPPRESLPKPSRGILSRFRRN